MSQKNSVDKNDFVLEVEEIHSNTNNNQFNQNYKDNTFNSTYNNELSDLKNLNATAETTVEHNTSNSNKSGSTHDN